MGGLPSLLHAGRIAIALLFWPVLAFVVWGELASHGQLESTWFADINDNILHFSAYFVLAAMAAMALRARRLVGYAVLGLIMLGAVLEVVQGIVGRDPSLSDALANAAGALSGGIIGRLIAEPARRRYAANRIR